MSSNFISMQLLKIEQEQKQKELQNSGYDKNSQIAEDNVKAIVNGYLNELDSVTDKDVRASIVSKLKSIESSSGKSLESMTGSSIESSLFDDDSFSVASSAATTSGKKTTGYGMSHSSGPDRSGYGRTDAQVREEENIIKELSAEFGVSFNEEFSTQRKWGELAAISDKVNVYDKNGVNVDDQGVRNSINNGGGLIKKGDILEIKSAKYGNVKIMVGGDGDLTGGDDKIISMGMDEAAQGIEAGMNNVNSQMQGTLDNVNVASVAEDSNTNIGGDLAINKNPLLSTISNNSALMDMLSSIDENDDEAIKQKLMETYNLPEETINNLMAAILKLTNETY